MTIVTVSVIPNLYYNQSYYERVVKFKKSMTHSEMLVVILTNNIEMGEFKLLIFEMGTLRVRKLSNKDADYLVQWLSNPLVLQYYDGRDRPKNIEMVREIFFQEDSEMRCIVEYDSKAIGYIQFYELDDEGKGKYGYTNLKEKIYGTDQFIGEVNYWNKGIGKLLVSSMVNYLITELDVSKIVMDPQTWNVRAIACYEKCGFKKVQLLPKHEWHEGELRDSWLMEFSK
jgi:aminoglycoside 6'-N-acetyltransferase